MSDPSGVEERLRAALRGDDTGGGEGAGRGDSHSRVRTRVLVGIRQRRLRRLQMVGGAAVVVLALAVGLPQVFGSATPAPGRPSGHQQSTKRPASSATAAPSISPSSGKIAGGNQPAAHGSTARAKPDATCLVAASRARSCGMIATGSGGTSLATAADAAERAVSSPAVFSSVAPAAESHLGKKMVVRAGSVIVVELPHTKSTWRWSVPKIADTPVYHGLGPPVVVREVRARGRTQRFVVTTRFPVSVVLEAQESVYVGKAAPSIVEAPAVWALELEMEAK